MLKKLNTLSPSYLIINTETKVKALIITISNNIY